MAVAACGGGSPTSTFVDDGGAGDGTIGLPDGGSSGDIPDGPTFGGDAPSDAPVSACTPRTCAQLNVGCGKQGDGCGGVLDCGTCTSPQTCGGGGTPSQCGGTQGCIPKTKCATGITCGVDSDGCGGSINCGTCASPLSCGGGGTPSQCGKPACVPKTTCPAGVTCGVASDGCGGTISCGTCTFPATCGGSGVRNVCGTPPLPDSGVDGGSPCVPSTTCPAGTTCGPTGDGCGGVIQCGNCTAPQTCGGGGVPGQCGGALGCVPKTTCPAGQNCGVAADGCGGSITCGGCSAPQTCGGGGTPNVCGQPTCTPKTCAQLGLNCGVAGDGCGGLTASCGTCSAPQYCGGGGFDLCGPTSVGSCDGGTATMTGYVFDPANNLPVYNALVYFPTGAVQVPQTGVVPAQCGCSAPPAYASAYTGIDGKFTINNPPVGASQTLVVQLGKWQRVFTQSIVCGTNNIGGGTAGAPQNLRLPSTHLQGNIPLFAIDTGNVDTMECVLLKMGIAQSEFVNPVIAAGKPTAAQRVHIYKGSIRNGGAVINGSTPTEAALTETASVMNAYDVVLFPCQGSRGTYDNANGFPNTLGNLLGYTAAGGRAFATHFHYDLLNGNGSFSGTANWTLDNGSWGNLNSDGTWTSIIDQTFGRGDTLAKWLNQPIVLGGTLGQIPVGVIRNDFASVNAPAQRWMYTADGTGTGGPPADLPIHYTFDTPFNQSPTCGRVVYSDFHVESSSGSNGRIFPAECASGAMTPQEKLLEFMLFDLTSCVSAPACVAKTCQQIGSNCGQQGDGCGGVINCGACPTGQVCGGGGVPGVCGGGCTRIGCPAGQNCGIAPDGCGGSVPCGTCNPPQSCGGGGTPNQCGAPSCTPQACPPAVKCGPAGDGCGGLIASCGSCTPPQYCGGGGPGVCGFGDAGGGCVPLTCAQQGVSCGPTGDGCGNVIQCGPCTPPQTCGGGGTPGTCGGACKPITCAQQNIKCGPAGDGCGGALDCGPCTPPQTCGGGGTPGICGQPACTPKTCAQLGFNCGIQGDGCGNTVDCGTCVPPQTCGGAGNPGVCGGGTR